MKKLILIAMCMLAGCSKADDAPKADAKGPPAHANSGPPPIPPYQMRAEMAAGNRLAVSGSGEAIFSNRCGSCHLAGGMGTNLLTKQMMIAKRPPTDGMLTNRNDLTPDYVKSVVRQGKMAMPRLSRVEVTDSELEAISSYLGKTPK
jgi:mono/diheme cytochrome c family protein